MDYDYDYIDEPGRGDAPEGAVYEIFQVHDSEVVGYADTKEGALELIEELES